MRSTVRTFEKPRVNWFSPLPPERSGIADFTAALAPLLRDRAEMRFVSQRVAAGQSVVEAAPLDDLSQPDINRADLNVFNLGNNATFHDGIWRSSLTTCGIVILHDARLQHLFGGMFLTTARNRRAYMDLMRETYGVHGVAAATLMADGRVRPETVSELFPLVEAGVRSAAGIVVHSTEALRIVRERVDIPVIKLNLPLAAGEPPRSPTSRSGAKRRRLELVVFGHVGPNRRVESVMHALAACGWTPVPHLHLIGDLWNEARLRNCVRELRLEARVTFHGHLDEARLDEHLRRADLIVNLRWPTMGEASYTQLRAFKHGVPTLVSAAGWYADLPNDAVVQIAPDREVEQIVEALARLRADPTAFREIGMRGRGLLEEQHRPDVYVDQLLEFGVSQARAGHAIERDLAARVAAQVASFSDDAAAVLLDALRQRRFLPS